MKLDKALDDRTLVSSVFTGVREFHKSKYAYDAMSVQETEFFKQMKPRL